MLRLQVLFGALDLFSVCPRMLWVNLCNLLWGFRQHRKLTVPLEKTSMAGSLQPCPQPPPHGHRRGKAQARGAGAEALQNALCQRRSRDFHAFCVHSFWAGSGFVFQNLLVTLSYCTLPFSFVGFAFFSLQAGFSGLVWGSPLPTLCSCSQCSGCHRLFGGSGAQGALLPLLTTEEGMPLPLNTSSRPNGRWKKSLHSHGCSRNPNTCPRAWSTNLAWVVEHPEQSRPRCQG